MYRWSRRLPRGLTPGCVHKTAAIAAKQPDTPTYPNDVVTIPPHQPQSGPTRFEASPEEFQRAIDEDLVYTPDQKELGGLVPSDVEAGDLVSPASLNDLVSINQLKEQQEPVIVGVVDDVLDKPLIPVYIYLRADEDVVAGLDDLFAHIDGAEGRYQTFGADLTVTFELPDIASEIDFCFVDQFLR